MVLAKLCPAVPREARSRKIQRGTRDGIRSSSGNSPRRIIRLVSGNDRAVGWPKAARVFPKREVRFQRTPGLTAERTGPADATRAESEPWRALDPRGFDALCVFYKSRLRALSCRLAICSGNVGAGQFIPSKFFKVPRSNTGNQKERKVNVK